MAPSHGRDPDPCYTELSEQSDGYAGALRGVIARVAPQLQVETLTHGDSSPRHRGRHLLAGTLGASHSRGSTAHCAVVDPGVRGRSRPLVAARVDLQVVVAPDNGLLHFLWSRGQDRMAVRVDTSGFDPEGVQRHLPRQGHHRAAGRPRLPPARSGFEDLGSRTSPTPHLVSNFLPQGWWRDPRPPGGCLSDRFGNVVPTVARAPWYARVPSSATLESGRVVDTVVQTYGEIEGDFACSGTARATWRYAGNRMSAGRHPQPAGSATASESAWATPTR